MANCGTDWCVPFERFGHPRSRVLSNELLDLFARQNGVVSRDQFLEVESVNRSALSRARRDGWLVPMTNRTVRMRCAPDSFLARCQAVCLEVGGVGFLSGQTAGRLDGLRRMNIRHVEVTLPHERHIAFPEWVEVRSTNWYSASDRDRRRSDLHVASPNRMLFGLAAVFNQYRFERAAEDAWHLGLVTPREAAEYLELHRCRRKDGVSTMERWLERALPRERPSQSGLELDLLAALDRLELPIPERQHPVTLADGEVVHIDIAWPVIRFGVEPGAMWWHGGDERQRLDQARDVACGEVGWHIIRFDERLRDDPLGAARKIERVYRERARMLRSRICP